MNNNETIDSNPSEMDNFIKDIETSMEDTVDLSDILGEIDDRTNGN